jgi:hypothetical protein
LGPDNIVPGPGTYDPLKPLGESALKFQLKSRLDYFETEKVEKRRNIPPPGTYDDCQGIEKTGTYNFNSEWNNSKAARWGPVHDRFKYVKTTRDMTPGPGNYEQVGEV